MKSTLDDGSISSGSFVETSSFDPQKEAAAIKELNRRWEAEADKLKNVGSSQRAPWGDGGASGPGTYWRSRRGRIIGYDEAAEGEGCQGR